MCYSSFVSCTAVGQAVLDVLVLVLVLAGIPGSLVLVEEAVYCVLYLHGH